MIQLLESQLKISNANQYMIPLEEMGLISRVEVPRENNSPYKVSFIDSSTKLKAENFLKKYNRLNSETPFHIINFDYEEKQITKSNQKQKPTKRQDK